ncbi:MAG: type II toxin-antitoxin system VapC family toxin [Mucilaginibacter sp.]
MKLFLDTSKLIKLYFKEEDTSDLDQLFTNYSITKIYLSEISKVEFFSAIYKKARTKTLTLKNANDIITAFVSDEEKYSFIAINEAIINSSQKLIEKYGAGGLRTLDALQLSAACSISHIIDAALSNDKLLNSFLEAENILISLKRA